MIQRTLVALALALAFVSCASNPSGLDEDQTPRSRYSAESGESAVGVIPEGFLRDETRGKDVPFTIEYPQRPGPHPLIIFSHGFGGSNRAYVGLSSYWASQGYVVLKPGHADAGKLTGSVQDIWSSQTPADWRNRVRDVTFFLDAKDALEQKYPELVGKIDWNKVGVGGHSYGAYTAMLAGGVRTFPGGTSYADPRIKAIVAMSPQGTGDVRGLTNESWAELRIPAMFMTGTEDRGPAENETPEWRRQAFENSPAGEKWLIVIAGARHGTFTGRVDAPFQQPTETTIPRMDDPTNPDPTRDPRRNPGIPSTTQRGPAREGPGGLRQRGLFGTAKAISLMFWDTYLRNDQEGRTALEKAGERYGVEVVKK
ncbi:MAG: alpha/beta hydrolase family protein [Thermoanaerobaculia bacterium]